MTASARDIIFNHSERVAPLGLIAIPGSEELGKKVNVMMFILLPTSATTALNIRCSAE